MTATLIILGIIVLIAVWLGLKTLYLLIKSNLTTGFSIFKTLFFGLLFFIILGVLIYLYFRLKATGFFNLN